MELRNLFSKVNLINFMLLTIPVSYIIGNLVLNLNIIILILISLFFYKGKIFSDKLTNLDKIIIMLFLYIFLNGVYNNFFNLPDNAKENIIFVKSFFYLRFLVLYFVLKFLIKEDIINLEKIFKFYSLVVIFVSIDLIIQYFIGFDIFGFEATSRRLSGPFGDEQIAGSFIQRFFIFPLFTIIFFLSPIKNLVLNLYIFLIISLSAIGILLSGNRMPFLLFSMMLAFFFFFKKEVRNALVLTIILFSFSFLYFLNSNINFKAHYIGVVVEANKISNYLKLKISGKSMLHLKSSYVKEIESGVLTWQENKIFGGGIKSFHYNCRSINPEKWTLYGGVNCNQHPHNYYLEAVASLGILGLLIFLIMIFMIILTSAKEYFSIKKTSRIKNLIYPFLVLFFTEIFPLKTTGSLFTTGNATFLFFIIAFTVGLTEYNSKRDSYEQ
jgi:hypothetical protein